MANVEPVFTRLEHIPTSIYASSDEACATVADAITQLTESRNAEGKPTVRGLVIGSTLVRHQFRLDRDLIRRTTGHRPRTARQRWNASSSITDARYSRNYCFAVLYSDNCDTNCFTTSGCS